VTKVVLDKGGGRAGGIGKALSQPQRPKNSQGNSRGRGPGTRGKKCGLSSRTLRPEKTCRANTSEKKKGRAPQKQEKRVQKGKTPGGEVVRPARKERKRNTRQEKKPGGEKAECNEHKIQLIGGGREMWKKWGV